MILYFIILSKKFLMDFGKIRTCSARLSWCHVVRWKCFKNYCFVQKGKKKNKIEEKWQKHDKKKCVWHVNFFSQFLFIYVSPIYWSFIFNLPLHLFHKDPLTSQRQFKRKATQYGAYTLFKNMKKVFDFLNEFLLFRLVFLAVFHYSTIHHRIRAFLQSCF